MKKLAVFFFVPLLLLGCSSNEKTIEIVDPLEQSEKKEDVREVMKNYNDIYSGTAIFIEDQLFVAVQAKPWLDYKKGNIESDLKKQLEEKLPDLNITVSADYKAYWEANKLVEEKEQQKIKDQVEKVKKLLKEET